MNKREAQNTFRDGMISDFNPINTPSTVLTDALNATIFTNNGNEGILQNDLGNARVEKVYLKDGYSPIGTCEYGGIIYIVSYNPFDKRAEIGSFPSPRMNHYQELNGDYQPIDDKAFLNEEKILQGTAYLMLNKKSVVLELSKDVLSPGNKYLIYSKNIPTIGEKNGRKYLKVTPVAIEDSGKITELATKLEECLVTKWDDNSSNTPNAFENFRSKTVGTNYRVFDSKVPGKLGLKFEIVQISDFTVTWSENYAWRDNELDTNDHDALLQFTWKGDGIVDGIATSFNGGDYKITPFETSLNFTKMATEVGYISEETKEVSEEKEIDFFKNITLNYCEGVINPKFPYTIPKNNETPKLKVRRRVLGKTAYSLVSISAKTLYEATLENKEVQQLQDINNVDHYLKGELYKTLTINNVQYENWYKLTTPTTLYVNDDYPKDKTGTFTFKEYTINCDETNKVLLSKYPSVFNPYPDLNFNIDTTNDPHTFQYLIFCTKDGIPVQNAFGDLHWLTEKVSTGYDNFKAVYQNIKWIDGIPFWGSTWESKQTTIDINRGNWIDLPDGTELRSIEGYDAVFRVINSETSGLSVESGTLYYLMIKNYDNTIVVDNVSYNVDGDLWMPLFPAYSTNDSLWKFKATYSISGSEYNKPLYWILSVSSPEFNNSFITNDNNLISISEQTIEIKNSLDGGAIETDNPNYDFKMRFKDSEITFVNGKSDKLNYDDYIPTIIFDEDYTDEDKGSIIYYLDGEWIKDLNSIKKDKKATTIISASYTGENYNPKTIECKISYTTVVKKTLGKGAHIWESLLHKHDKPIYIPLGKSNTPDESGRITYDVQPLYPFGYDPTLKRTITIDWSLMNSGTYELNNWKYYVNQDYVLFNFDLSLYPLINYSIIGVDLEFYDNNGLTFTYQIRNRSGYSGSYDFNIPLNGNSLLSEMLVNPEGHHRNQEFTFDIPSLKETYTLFSSTKKKLVEVNNTYVKESDEVLYINDAGILYSNLVYAVKIVIYHGINEVLEVVKTFGRILWTNGIYNEYYNVLPSFDDQNIEVQIAPELSYNVNNFTSELKDSTQVNKYELGVTLKPTIINGYNLIDIADKNNLNFTVYKGLHDVIDSEAYLKDNEYVETVELEDGSSVLIPYSEATITSKFESEGSLTHLNYVTDDGEAIEGDFETVLVEDNKFTLTETLSKETKGSKIGTYPLKLYIIVEPILKTLEDFTSYGFTITSDNIYFTRCIFWGAIDLSYKYGDYQITYFARTDGPETTSGNGLVTDNFVQREASSTQGDGLFLVTRDNATGIWKGTSKHENETAKHPYIKIGADNGGSKAGDWSISSYKNGSATRYTVYDGKEIPGSNVMFEPGRFVLLNAKPFRNSLTYKSAINSVNTYLPGNYFEKTDITKWDYDNKFAIGFYDLSGNLHLTNTFYIPTQTEKNPALDIASLLSQVYVLTGTVQEQRDKIAYTPEHDIIFKDYLIIKTSSDNTPKITILGEEYSKYMETLYTYLEFTDSKKTEFELKYPQRVYPLTFKMTSYFPDEDLGNVKVYLPCTKDYKYINADVLKNVLYLLIEDSLVEANSVNFNIYNFSKKDDVLTISKSNKDNKVSPNFDSIFTYRGNLRLTHDEFETRADYFSVGLRCTVDNTGDTKGGGWLDCRVDETIIEGQDFYLLSNELGNTVENNK